MHSGKVFRLKGKGFPDLKSYEKGDQLVHIIIWVPQVLTKEEQNALKKMSESENFKPNPEKEENHFSKKSKIFLANSINHDYKNRGVFIR